LASTPPPSKIPARKDRPSRQLCRHCKTRRASLRRRGLCWKCHADGNVRKDYGFVRRKGQGGGGYGVAGAINPRGRQPAQPTGAAPGSEEKIAVLEERARLGLAMRHPDDAPMDAESRKLGVD
jgi:hypothetical protein